MRENYEMFKKDYDELMSLACANMFDASTMMEMNVDEIRAMQLAFKLANSAMKLVESQIGAMERIEDKLDRLLEKE